MHVITADYLPKNPGHKISDEYYNISTIEKEKILELSQDLQIDAISAYASDPSATTAAYVSDKMGLVGGGYHAVTTLSNKSLFRKFLNNNGFLCPYFISGKTINEILDNYWGSKAIIKPVDSSGSKGIYTISSREELIEKFPLTKNVSPSGNVILEEYIERKGSQIHGEGFVLNGELVFILLGDQVFSTINNLIPYSTTIPSYYHQDIMPEVIKIVKNAIKKVGYQTGGINVEVIRDINDKLYILEIGARNGGNFMPQLAFYATGFDLAKANVDSLIGYDIPSKYNIPIDKYYSQVILHSKKAGSFVEINIPKELQNYICEKNIYYSKGTQLKKYSNSRDVVGVIIFEVPINMLESYKKHINQNNWVIVSE
ncbi:MAG: ATP-grasp domain-containing protein [Candidatus Helarchaeota archaeon]